MLRSLVPRRAWGWPAVTGFETEMGDLMERFFGSSENWLKGSDVFTPRMNFVETETDYEATVELPGMKADDFHVEVEDHHLRISGEKKEQKEEKGKTFRRVERHSGEFRRVIPLTGEIDAGKVSAEYKDGVLTVRVPKTARSKPHKVEIKS